MTRRPTLLTLLRQPGDDFKKRGRCAETDPEAFFPEKGRVPDAAKRVCARCEVRQECLDWALRTDERFGVWGGMSENERRKLRKRKAPANA